MQLVSPCQTDLLLKLNDSRRSYWCNTEILQPKDLIIVQNEFVMYMLSNAFEAKYLNNVIKTRKSENQTNN